MSTTEEFESEVNMGMHAPVSKDARGHRVTIALGAVLSLARSGGCGPAALTVLLLLLFASSADALNINVYTDPNCGDVSTYVPATRACRGGDAIVRTTIDGGIQALTSGDTLHIREGTYDAAIGSV